MRLQLYSLDNLKNTVLQYKSNSATTLHLYPWDAADPTASYETLTSAEIAYFMHLHWGEVYPYWESVAFVKNPADPYYSNNGYPNPPMGGTFRTVARDGSLGTGNFLEIMPAIFTAVLASKAGNQDIASKALSFIDFMTVESSFYGSPLTVVAGIARYNNGSWQKHYDTVFPRVVAGAAWAYFTYAEAFNAPEQAAKGEKLLKTVALIQNNIRARTQRGELPSLLRGLSYGHIVSTGNGHAFTWNRFSIESIWFMVEALIAASRWYGIDAVLYDAEGTAYNPKYLLAEMARGWDNWLNSGRGIMKDRNPYSLYLPYQFIYQQAWLNHPNAIVGVNFDWTEESGTLFGDTWWVGDLELWGLIGLAILKTLYPTWFKFDLTQFVWEWEDLSVNNTPLWHDRYDFYGNPLPHDHSISTAFTGLYGILRRYINVYGPRKVSEDAFEVLKLLPNSSTAQSKCRRGVYRVEAASIDPDVRQISYLGTEMTVYPNQTIYLDTGVTSPGLKCVLKVRPGILTQMPDWSDAIWSQPTSPPPEIAGPSYGVYDNPGI